MKISKLIRKALEYGNNGDPLSDVISGDAEWADVLEYTVSLEERIQQLEKWRQNDCRIIDAQRRWIPVSEGLPKDRASVLIRCPENKNTYCACYMGDYWIIFGSIESTEVNESEVTHWMKLPSPPKENDK